MAENKIFAGPRIRRIRNGLAISQTGMAEALGISPSYLNLIERNQRPLTVQLLLKLASVYKVDLDELQGEAGGNAKQLREVFADPLLVGEIPGDGELIEVAEVAPNATSGIIKLYRAYRDQMGRLSDLVGLLASQGLETTISSARLPMDEVREILERRANFYARIEEGAEAFHESLKPGDDLGNALKAWLKTRHGIVVRALPVHVMADLRRRYDRHSMRLFLSERLSPYDQLHEIALTVSLIALKDEIIGELDAMVFSTDEARRIARFELARYGAMALMMPYGRFLDVAKRVRYDIDILTARFNVSFEQAANRLTTLARPGQSGVAFFMLEADHAGHNLRKVGACGYPSARFGGGCPKLNLFAAFSQPGQILVDPVELPDGAQFLTIARTADGLQSTFGERARRTSLLIGCDLVYHKEVIYADALSGKVGEALGVGKSCRLCERQGCLARAQPPVTRPLGLDETVSGMSLFDFQ